MKVKQGLQTALPRLRQTVVKKRSLVVGAMLEAQTLLPLPTEW